MRILKILACSALLFACRSSDNNNGTDGGGGGGGDGGSGGSGFLTIQQVQDPATAAGTPVNLQGVIVTVIDDYGAKTGDMWVEEPGGGMYSGVHVYNAPVSMVASLQPGDIITLKGGEKAEFALSSDTTGRTLTEVEPITGGTMTVTKTGTGSVPAPATVDALMIGQMTDVNNNGDRSKAWGAWEGVLITVTNVSALGVPKCIGSACTDPTDQQFSITGDAEVESELAAFPMTGSASAITSHECLASVTGVVDYFFDYLILPAATTDVASGGTACPPPEQANGTNGSACTDGIDNDGNGFTDCADLGCEIGSAAWLGADGCLPADTMCGCSKNYQAGASINGVNTNNATASNAVYLRNVYITAVDSTFSYWVADSLTAAAKGGVYVFAKPPAGATQGQLIATLQGIAGPYSALGTGSNAMTTQIELTDVTASTPGTGGVIVPLLGQTAATVTNLANGGPYAGSVVTLGPLKAVSFGTFSQATFTDANGTTVIMDDDAFHYYGGSNSSAEPPGFVVGSCYTVTGVMDVFSNTTAKTQNRTINPRTATDIATATCTF